MKKIIFITLIISILCWSCNEQAQVNSDIEGIAAVEGEDLGPIDTNGNLGSKELKSGVDNPHGLAVAILSPYNGNSETHVNWSPPGHWVPWYGDWAVDLWKDNGNNSTDYAWSCSEDVYIDAIPITYPGGKKPQSLKAKLISKGDACAWGGFQRGGYMQKWEIIATYNGVDYRLGWLLYAHLAYLEYTNIGTVVDLSSKVKIGKAFWGSYTSGCWGSCHMHLEFYNYRKYSCYNLMPPAIDIETIGIIGGLASSTGHCPDINASPVNLAEDAVNCIRNSAYNSNYECSKAYDGSVYTKWTSNGSSMQSSMAIDLGGVKDISKIVVKHAGSGGEPNYLNTEHFKIEYSDHSIWGPWTHAGEGYNYPPRANETTLNLNFAARYVHLYIIDPGIDNYSRIPEFQVWGN